MHQPAHPGSGSTLIDSLGTLAKTTTTPPESLAFFSALNASANVRSGRLHPVCARNSGLLAAWSALESRFRPSPLSLIGRVSRNYEENLDLLCQSVARDPLWQQGRIKVGDDPRNIETSLAQATAQLMFWTRRNAVIEPTDALERLLVESVQNRGRLRGVRSVTQPVENQCGSAILAGQSTTGAHHAFDHRSTVR